MTDRSARKAASPLVVALRLALQEAAARRAAGAAERRETLRVVGPRKAEAA